MFSVCLKRLCIFQLMGVMFYICRLTPGLYLCPSGVGHLIMCYNVFIMLAHRESPLSLTFRQPIFSVFLQGKLSFASVGHMRALLPETILNYIFGLRIFYLLFDHVGGINSGPYISPQ